MVDFDHAAEAAFPRPPLAERGRVAGILGGELAEPLEPFRVERAGVDRGRDRAARLALVPAVGEAATARRASATSAKTSAMPASTSAICSSRMPGVSISQPPAASRCIERPVVVWRPCASSSRMPATDCRPSPASVLTSVDLPTPDEPTSATVWPGPHHGASRGHGIRIAGVEALDEEPGQQPRRGAST